MPARIKAFGLSALIATTAMISHANATDVSGQLTVKAAITSGCELKSGDNSVLDFGDGSNSSATNTATTAKGAGIQVQCSTDLPYTVYLNAGLNPLNGITTIQATRQLKNGQDFVGYQLYKDSARTLRWGWDDVLANGLAGTGNGAVQELPVYGIVSTTNGVSAGTYTDTVTVKLSF
ncbi:spore coat U domain-containing protein [Brucella sp. 21LCYQ03]|nr:spore coat U domain-containing protein [Brucella sp. 21LCYQ03]